MYLLEVRHVLSGMLVESEDHFQSVPTVWLPGNKLRSSGMATGTFGHGAISLTGA